MRKLFSTLWTRGTRTHKPQRRRPLRAQIGLECLEDRLVLSTLTVLNTSDTGIPGDGSLRGEIAAAAPGDHIKFDSSLFGQTIALQQGALVIDKSLDIGAPPGNTVYISGSNLDTVFEINSPSAVVSLSGLTIENGFSFFAGGIFNAGTLTVDHCTVSNNTNWGSLGGGIHNAGKLTLDHSMVSNNAALVGLFGGGGGGGIENFGTMIISDSTVSSNTADDSGGGIENDGALAMSNSAVSNNTAGIVGGGISNGGLLRVSNSTVSNNTTSVHGGGIFNGGLLSLTNSTVSGNFADGGGGIYSAGSLTLVHSTVSNNNAASFGGGIANFGNIPGNGGSLIIDHSTVSNNTALAGDGGGIYNSGSLAVLSSTVSNNTAVVGDGGGIVSGFGTSLFLANSILCGNTPDNIVGAYIDGGNNTFC